MLNLAICILTAKFFFVLGDFNQQCPVPDLAQLCESNCSDEIFNCIMECEENQGTVFFFWYFFLIFITFIITLSFFNNS